MAIVQPVLDLTTDLERPTVKIDQVAYLLRTARDLTLDAYKALERATPRIAALLLADVLSADEGQELSHLLDSACQIALIAPEAVHAKLGDVQRMQIFQVFTERLTPKLRMAASARPTTAGRAAGTKPSRGSNGSTAAPPRVGSRRRRSASSART
jgi:hypothetical protein